VVVPFQGLIEDMINRVQKSGIDSMEWKHGETNPASVVVVSADVASSAGFLGYAALLSGKKLLRRIVIDECHLIVTWSDWGPRLAKLGNLRVLGCPIVLVTATLRPVLEQELGESMLIRWATYIRASTVRRNIRYMVSLCRRGQKQEMALAMCKRQLQRLEGGGRGGGGGNALKGVIYCSSKMQCKVMAEELGCGYYHSGVADGAERVEEWIKRERVYSGSISTWDGCGLWWDCVHTACWYAVEHD
jgi:superfamily II DNA helicase RecQ